MFFCYKSNIWKFEVYLHNLKLKRKTRFFPFLPYLCRILKALTPLKFEIKLCSTKYVGLISDYYSKTNFGNLNILFLSENLLKLIFASTFFSSKTDIWYTKYSVYQTVLYPMILSSSVHGGDKSCRVEGFPGCILSGEIHSPLIPDHLTTCPPACLPT